MGDMKFLSKAAAAEAYTVVESENHALRKRIEELQAENKQLHDVARHYNRLYAGAQTKLAAMKLVLASPVEEILP